MKEILLRLKQLLNCSQQELAAIFQVSVRTLERTAKLPKKHKEGIKYVLVLTLLEELPVRKRRKILESLCSKNSMLLQ
jgi:hypothetical protein